VLALVLAHRDLPRLVGEHIRRLEDRIEEEPRGDELALPCGLLLELMHPIEVAVGGERSQVPGELGVLADVGLAEEDAALRVEPGGEQDGGRVVEVLPQGGGIPGNGDRVQVDDAVDRRVTTFLALDVLPNRTDVVAEVLAAGGLDAAEDSHRGADYRNRTSTRLSARRLTGGLG
jgi:hypothetical protein